jgi:hypothetical protein
MSFKLGFARRWIFISYLLDSYCLVSYIRILLHQNFLNPTRSGSERCRMIGYSGLSDESYAYLTSCGQFFVTAIILIVALVFVAYQTTSNHVLRKHFRKFIRCKFISVLKGISDEGYHGTNA